MKIKINSLEYQCWHEVGHAIVCLYLGGDVKFIEFSEDDFQKGLAKTRCETTPNIRPYVLCGGFATEYVLWKKGFLFTVDESKFIQIIFRNATYDREMFLNKTKHDKITQEDDENFMSFSVKKVAPIINKHLRSMEKIVMELRSLKRIDNIKIKEILNKK